MTEHRAVIIDDEEKGRKTLYNLITEYCDNIEIVGMGESVKTGIEVINTHQPDLVFLDISMPDGTGFDLLQQLPERDFNLIFVTAHDEYAIRAFEFSALHYILKPANVDDIITAVERATKKGNQPQRMPDRLSILENVINNNLKRITINTNDGLMFFELESIVRFEADGNYSVIYLIDGGNYIIPKTLGKFEELLYECLFCRVHSKHLVNLNFVKKFMKSKNGGTLELYSGDIVPLSVRKKEEFLQLMSTISPRA